MFVTHGAHSRLVVLTEYRTKYDAQLDAALPKSAPHVLDSYRIGRDSFGGRGWAHTCRIALFEYDQVHTKHERLAALTELETFLEREKPRVVVYIANEVGGKLKRGGLVARSVFDPPDALGQFTGCFHEYAPGRYVMPAHSLTHKLKQMLIWQQSRFLKRAREVAEGEPLLACPKKIISPYQSPKPLEGSRLLHMVWGLASMVHKPLAVDIESIESCGKITAIGISDGHVAVSVPWDSFIPAGRDTPEPGYRDVPCGASYHRRVKELLAAPTQKYFHNFTFDVPRLEQEGFTIGGSIHDTFAAHAIAFPELRHGLQLACADVLPIRPWKSAWHPKLPGINRDDEEYWSCDPDALRDYNCDDAFHTWHLARAVLPCVGVNPE